MLQHKSKFRALLFPLLILPALSAQTYTFTKVFDSANGFDPFGTACPAINNIGQVAIRATPLSTGIKGVYRIGRKSPVLIAESQDFGTLGDPALNDAGQVAFWASQTTGSEIIERGDGNSLIPIASGENYEFLSNDVSINDLGQVAFQGTLNSLDSGLFVSDGRTTQTRYLASNSIFSGVTFAPSINNRGQVAFYDLLHAGGSGIFRSQPNGSIQKIADQSGPISLFGDLKINAEGVVVFEAGLGRSGSAIYVAAPPASAPLALAAGPFSLVTSGGPSINDAGTVAFSEDFKVTNQTLFVFQTGQRLKVLASGDGLDGSTVNLILFCRHGLNNLGQLAFETQLADGRVAVFVASPQH